MNKQSIADRLASTTGINTVFVRDGNKQGFYKPVNEKVTNNLSVLTLAAAVACETGQDVRLVIGTQTVLAEPLDNSGGAVVVVSMDTGHSVAKSVRRMISRATRHGITAEASA